MKTLKSLLFALALVVTSTVVKANDEPTAARLSKDYAVASYINAVANGKMEGLNDALDQTAKFSILRGKTVLSYSKEDMLKFMNTTKDVKQACSTSASVVESNSDMAIVKVDMNYKDFVRSNYVTIANTGNGWKITNVYSVFK